MQDKYLDFVRSGFGKWLSANLGLPQPVPLRRYRAGEPEFNGPFLVGAAPDGALLETLAALFAGIGVPTRFHDSDPAWLGAANRHGQITGRFVAPTGREGEAFAPSAASCSMQRASHRPRGWMRCTTCSTTACARSAAAGA